jgi:PAS domain S-box-containing protein
VLSPDVPIRRKLIAMMLLISGVVLTLVCAVFIAYDVLTFRQALVDHVSALGRVVAANSTAALAFENEDDAADTLSGLRAEPFITHAALYDRNGVLFAKYPPEIAVEALPRALRSDGYYFEGSDLVAMQAVDDGARRWGTLYLRSGLDALYERLLLYGAVAVAVLAIALLVAYALSRILQRHISGPIVELANTARAVSDHRDYSVRAAKAGQDELGLLTDAFNQMLAQIQQQDRSLRSSEARLRAVLDSAIMAVIVIDASGLIIDWNDRAEAVFGWNRAEVLGRDLADLIIPQARRDAHRRGLERAPENGGTTILNKLVEMTALRRDGSEFPVELSVSRLDTEGAVRFCGFITDITERKFARDRLQEQLNRLDLLQRITRAIGERQDLQSIFQVVLENLEEKLPIDFGLIGLHVPAGHEVIVSSVGARSKSLAKELMLEEQTRLAVDASDLFGSLGGKLIYTPDAGRKSSSLEARFARSGLRSVVFAPLLAESRVFGVLVAALRAPNSFSSNACEFLRQLSEHVALAAHQTQLYRDLQQAYGELRQSQQTIVQQERLRALGQIASGVAHDINNAISPVALYTESLLESEPGLSERARRYLETIDRAIHDVAQTVSRMREFYRPRAGDLPLERVNLNEIVQQVVELTRVRWRDLPQERGVVIDLHTPLQEPLPEILGIESDIRDALRNLIFNAVDAMPDGGTLTVGTRVSDASDPKAQLVHLDVRDTGIGMNEETRQHCLEPFFTTKGERGTGLGLAMVYGMIQRHGARLEVRSALAQGTTMRVSFPLAVDRAAAPAPVPAPHRALRSWNILTVDDDPLIMESLRATLENEGHRVTSANGGQQAIDLFYKAYGDGKPFDLVITDLGMPYVDGRRVAAAIKTASPTTPVILLTGWGQRLLDDNEVPIHVDRVLSKPPRLRELRTTLFAVMENASSV